MAHDHQAVHLGQAFGLKGIKKVKDRGRGNADFLGKAALKFVSVKHNRASRFYLGIIVAR